MRRTTLALVGALALTGCVAPADTHHRPGVDHSTATAAPPRDLLQTTVAIRAGHVEPPTTWLDVPVGATVTLSISSDVTDRVLVGGHELGKTSAAQPTEVTFVPDQAGVYEIRTADSSLVLAQVAATH